MKKDGVEWLTLAQICNKFNASPVVVLRDMEAAYVPSTNERGFTYFRMIEVMQVISGYRLCPTCLKVITGRKDKIYCGKPCRAQTARTLEKYAGLLNLGVPPIPVPITGYLMCKIRAYAAANDISLSQTVRYLLSKGVDDYA